MPLESHLWALVSVSWSCAWLNLWKTHPSEQSLFSPAVGRQLLNWGIKGKELTGFGGTLKFVPSAGAVAPVAVFLGGMVALVSRLKEAIQSSLIVFFSENNRGASAASRAKLLRY